MNREPWLGVLLSSLITGLGQFYARNIAAGAVFFILGTGLLVGGLHAFVSLNGNVPLGYWLLGGYLIVHFWSMIHGFRIIRRANSPEFETLRRSQKDPWLAVWLTTIFPGLGHAYLRKWPAAILLFPGIVLITIGIHAVAEIMADALHLRSARPWLLSGFSTAAGSLLLVAALLYAFASAPPRTGSSTRTIVLSIVMTAVFQQLLFNRYQYSKENFVQAYYVPGGSMAPTILNGDRIIVDHTRRENPKRGELIIFNHKLSNGEETVYIKRLIGLPGETVEIRNDGKLYIDGVVLNDSPINEFHYTQKIENHWGAMTENPYVVPRNCYFVLGDHSTTSLDSRTFGGVDQSDVLGVAYKIFWPISRAGPLK